MKILKHSLLLLDTVIRAVVQGSRYYILLIWGWGRKMPIHLYERRIYSQNGEDGIIGYIFHKIGTTNRRYVEIGAGDGVQCNTRLLKRLGWSGIQIDGQKNTGIKQHFVRADNVEQILKQYAVPLQFDLLSIDIDGNDYWIWEAIKTYEPRVVVIEYNAMLGPKKAWTIPYRQKQVWDGTDYFGASLQALVKLGKKKGYRLIGTDSKGINAFFVMTKLADTYFLKEKATDLFHPPGYAVYPHSTKNFVKV